MTDPIDPIRAPGDRRRGPCRHTDPQHPGPISPGVQVPAVIAADPPEDAQPMVSAQLIGQDGQKRGLRGGPETLAKAKAAYLNAEWSGPIDRRTRTGLISKTDV